MFTDDDAEQLSSLGLTNLDMRECDLVTDVGLESVLENPLTSLNLQGCNISELDLEQLRGLPLSKLILGPTEGFSDQKKDFLLGMPLKVSLQKTEVLRHGPFPICLKIDGRHFVGGLVSHPLALLLGRSLLISPYCKNMPTLAETGIAVQNKQLHIPYISPMPHRYVDESIWTKCGCLYSFSILLNIWGGNGGYPAK